MSIGTQIRKYRKHSKMTQSQMAEKLGVSFQAVSSWENDEYLPDLTRLKEIAHCLKISIQKLLEEKSPSDFNLRDRLSDEAHMHTFLKTTLRSGSFPLSYCALVYIDEINKSAIINTNRALHTSCHAFALGIATDEIIELLLFHGFLQVSNKQISDLPASSKCKEMLKLLSHRLGTPSKEPELCLARSIDLTYTLSVLTIEESDPDYFSVVQYAETLILPQLQALKNVVPKWYDAIYLLRYQILALLEAYKRLA